MATLPRIVFWFLISALVVGSATRLHAEAPKLDYLFPAGAQRGSTSKIQLHGKFSWPVKIWSPTAEMKIGEKEGEVEVSLPHDLTTNRIWFRIYNDQGASELRPLMVGELPEFAEREPNDSPKSPQQLSQLATPPNDANLLINGVLEKNNDVDCYQVHLQKGQTLVAEVEANTAFGSPIDSVLQLVTTQGTVVAENHDAVGLDPRLAFTAFKNQDYVLRIMAFPSQPNQSIRFSGGKDYVYRLCLTTGPYITHALPLSVQATDPPQLVEPFGWNIPQGTKLTAANELVSAPGWRGFAKVQLVEYDAPPFVTVTTKTNPAKTACPSSQTGCISQRKKKDFFELRLQKGRPYRLRVDAASVGSQLVPAVRLTKPDGKLAKETSESGPDKDATLDFTPDKEGPHLLTITDRYDRGGDQYYYRLTAKPLKADFALTFEATNYATKTGETLEIPINVSRTNAGSDKIGEITISIPNLPAGISSAPVVSKPDGDTAKKVTLKIDSAEKFSGLVKVVGEHGTQTGPTRTKPVFGESFEHVWLTVEETKASRDKASP